MHEDHDADHYFHPFVPELLYFCNNSHILDRVNFDHCEDHKSVGIKGVEENPQDEGVQNSHSFGDLHYVYDD